MDVSARVAIAEDLPVISRLAEGAIDELTPHRGGRIWSQLEARPLPVDQALETELADPNQLLSVGTIDDVIVGYGAAAPVTLHDGDRICRMGDLYVLADARGVGVGEAIMNFTLDWATRRGFTGIDSLALPGDRATKNFFESFGLVARSISVHRSLPS